MRRFVMVDFNKGINIIKHNFFKCFCNVGHSGTLLHAAGGSSSAHARNMPGNMRDPKHFCIVLFAFDFLKEKRNKLDHFVTGTHVEIETFFILAYIFLHNS